VLDTSELDRPVKTASVWQVRQPIYRPRANAGGVTRTFWRAAGTNAKIVHEPVEMVSLPVPGMQTEGIVYYRQGKLDEAEMLFRRLLHHLPEHATAHFMVGLIYVRKGHWPMASGTWKRDSRPAHGMPTGDAIWHRPTNWRGNRKKHRR
jgi:tetratricopeptide (TPR) repeat protein